MGKPANLFVSWLCVSAHSFTFEDTFFVLPIFPLQLSHWSSPDYNFSSGLTTKLQQRESNQGTLSISVEKMSVSLGGIALFFSLFNMLLSVSQNTHLFVPRSFTSVSHCFGQYSGKKRSAVWFRNTIWHQKFLYLCFLCEFLVNQIWSLNCLNIFTLHRHVVCCLHFSGQRGREVINRVCQRRWRWRRTFWLLHLFNF